MRRSLTAGILAATALGWAATGTAHAVDVADASTLDSIPAVSPGQLSDTVDGTAQKPASLVAEAGGNSARQVLPQAGNALRLV
jgi:mannose/fructose/N-acetylgalactosamine-specific phosphotransferase system component IIC